MRRRNKRREQLPLPGMLNVELVELAVDVLRRCELAGKTAAGEPHAPANPPGEERIDCV